MGGYITVTHAEAKHGQDFALDRVCQVRLVFFDKLWFKTARSVPRCLERKTPRR